MALNLGFLPAAVQNIIQDGILERRAQEALRPLLLWRGLCEQERHMGGIGERVTKTRPGLIQPDTEATAKRAPGTDPGVVDQSVEQYGYQIAPYGKSTDIHLPSSYLAAYNTFLDKMDKLIFHAAQTMGRICRDRILAAYGGGSTFTTDNPGAVTAVAVKDVTGFDQVLVNGSPVAVSVSNPLPVTIGAASRLVTAVVANDASSPPKGPGVLTISVALDYAQYETVVRGDAPFIMRQASRANDQLIVAGDTPTIATFRQGAATLRTHNVPTLPGTNLYGCFIDPHVENALFADAEFHDAIQAIGLTGPFADGAIGDYAGIRFIRQTEMQVIADDADYQAHIHRSLMFGEGVVVEAYVPISEFQNQATPQAIAGANHYKAPLDPVGVMSQVIRAPLDAAGEVVRASWLSDVDYCIPTDSKALTGTARVKRAVVIHTAGPAA